MYKKKTTALNAMVLRFISDSREISFRLDDCLPRKSRVATPHRSNNSIAGFWAFVKYSRVFVTVKNFHRKAKEGVQR